MKKFVLMMMVMLGGVMVGCTQAGDGAEEAPAATTEEAAPAEEAPMEDAG